MCGIVGAISTELKDDSLSLVGEVVNDQLQRGPDFQAIEKITTKNTSVIFGHNRLSIIDLSSQANQPMWDATAQYCIVYNGEIYNYLELRSELVNLGHVFNTVSDTEVILVAFKEWGIDAIQRFNGPFAFALFDKVNEQLWLVRDRFGVKPLYYYIHDNFLYFASSSNVLASHFNLAANLNYVAQGLTYLVYESDNEITPYQGLYSVKPAHYLKIQIAENKRILQQSIKYYDLYNRVNSLKETLANYSMQSLLALVLAKIEEASFLRLRSDVPVGVSLSGGLDSSTIAALIVEKHPEIVGFTFGHPQEKSSEGPLVHKLAQQIGIRAEYIWPSAHEIMRGLLDTLRAQDAPFAGLSMVAQYLVYQKVRQHGIKVLLGGQGADEAFMGYRKFHFFHVKQLLAQRRYLECLGFLVQLTPTVAAELNQAKLYWAQRHRYLKKTRLNMSLDLPAPAPLQLSHSHDKEIWVRQLCDVTQFSLPTLLRYEDRNSMGNSVESRLPFMDYQVIELGLALPEVIKLRKGYGKWPVREIIRGKIPESIRAARYKRGFDVPMAPLVQAGLGQSVRAHLQDHYEKIKSYIGSHNKIAQLFSDENFIHRRATLAEAITLLWLGKCY